MRIGLLGPLVVSDSATGRAGATGRANDAGATGQASDGRVIDVSGARLRGLLIRLALDAPRPVSSSALIEALWGDNPPADEANALQSLVSRLRRALGDADLVSQALGGYRLNIAHDDVDVHRFATLARDGRQQLRAGRPDAAAATLRQALDLWRGPVAETWGDTLEAAGWRARLDDQRLDAAADLIEAQIERGRHADVVTELDDLATRHPSRERLAGLLMRALAGAGRQADALDRYEALRTRLADELGVDPSPELQAIHLSILRGELGTVAAQGFSPRRGNLKAALTSFVGRDEEVARIGKLLDETRLITLVGPGGAGKTRLASVAGAAILDSTPDGVWLAELAPVTDGADVASAVLDALDLRDTVLLDRTTVTTPTAIRDATTRLIDALAGRAAVLVLDNCEHVIDAAARLADELLARCPSLRVVATSREPLGIVGESLVVVPPLRQPRDDAGCEEALSLPSVRLFADRAAAVDPAFRVDDGNVAHVVEIVRRLDGLPLAIELAAARLRSLPVSEIASRLSDRFRLLTGGSRTAMPRHRTLHAVVEWSWDLLTDAERLLAERLAVFAGTMRADDIAAICADASLPAGDIDDVLASLVEKSLLQSAFSDAEMRYRMLETLREFGLERLGERHEVGEFRRRHAARYATLVREAAPLTRTAAQLEWMARLEAERDNILAGLRFLCDTGPADDALEVAIALATYWTLTGRDSDSAYWLRLALCAPGRPSALTSLTAQTLHAISSITSDHTGDPAEVEASLAHLRELSHRLDDIEPPYDPMLALLRPVVALFSDDDQERVDRLVAEGLASPDPWVAAAVRMFHAAVAENSGDVETMRRDAETSLALFRDLGERWGLASSLGLLGQLKTMDGDLEGAIADIEEALALTESLGGHDDALMLRLRLADLHKRVGDITGSREDIAKLRRLGEGSSTSLHSVFANVALAELAMHEGDLDEARRLRDDVLDGQLARLPAVHPVQGHLSAIVMGLVARLSIKEGDLAAASDQLSQACGFAIATKDMPIVAQVGVVAARLAHASGRPSAAAKLLGAAARLRGADDLTQPDIAELTAILRDLLAARFASAYAKGKALDAEAARALIQAASARSLT